MTFDTADVKIKANLAKHDNALLVAMSNSHPALIAWENEALSTPPLRTPPSPPRTKGRQFQCKNLFKEFLHSDYIDDDFYFSDEDYMPGVPGVDVPAMDVGWSTSSPGEWVNDVCSNHCSKLPSVANDCFASEVDLDDGGSQVLQHEGTSVHHTTCRRFSKKKTSRNFYFGSRTSPLRRRKMARYFGFLHNQRVVGGLTKTLKWFLRDGRLHSRVVVKYLQPRFRVRKPFVWQASN